MYDPEQITIFAKTDCRGTQTPFGIKASDRTRHVYVIGKTGMGKSTLLENMAVQDIKNGNGLAFIDPHGQTAETLLDYIPEERKDDVVYFAPFDTDNPVSFNVMEDVGADKRHLVVSGLMSVFKKIWLDAWSARMEYILSNTLLALLEYPDATLLGVNRMLSDKEYRMRVIENVTDPAVKSFWVDEFLKYNERYMQEAGDAIKNKIGQFTSNPLIRNIIGQPHSSFDIRKIMDERKILIMNLSKGLVGDQNANLLGSMLTTRIYLAAMSRADLTAEQMKAAPNFYFYVDEFQSFANATFADILSEARKYKLNLTIAHQYIEQMEEEVRNAVFGNVGTIISFRVGPFDAEVLETVYTPTFLAPDIVNLGFAQICLTLMIDGIGSQPFSAVTLPPIEQTGISCKDIVIARSRALYTKNREPVEELINQWHTKNFSNKPPYVPKHLREAADGGTAPNTRANLKKYGPTGGPIKKNGNDVGNIQSRSNTRTEATEKKIERNTGYKPTKSTFVTNGSYTKESKDTRYVKKSDIVEVTQHKKNVARVNTSHTPIASKEVDRQRNKKNLDDLRSVLQKISNHSEVASEKISLTPQMKKDTKNENCKHDEKKKDSGLTDAVAQALSAATTAYDAKSKRQEAVLQKKQQAHVEQKKVVLQKVVVQKDNQSEKKITSIPTHKQRSVQPYRGNTIPVKKDLVPHTSTAPAQEEYIQGKNVDDSLSAKKLERMMRTNTSDKSPIK